MVATPVQNRGVYCMLGIGFWQVALTSAQAEMLPVYWPCVQCRSRIGVMPLATSRSAYCLTAVWYAVPLGVPDRPSQQSSLSGIRTACTFQAFMASTPAWSVGLPSHMPLPCTQANSPLDRLTPSSR
jgi:hypothetical protein